ncbi:hypothetical protein OAE79_02595 [Rhodopirellula sp.]|nr:MULTISPECIES: hypothetical protein [Pirellulaceae]MDB4339035.1 hypothetical protein [Rubripirellula sp.]MDB4679206.1 hypothetical protein [Rhodopirellula sp.]
MNPNLLFLLNLLSTWYMVGLIWMVQIVHYNLYDRVGTDAFAHYEAEHNRLITPIVGVPMLIEIITAAALLWATPDFLPKPVVWLGLGLILVIWLSTLALQIPAHQKLLSGFDLASYERLVNSNWIRTASWSARGALLAYYTSTALR